MDRQTAQGYAETKQGIDIIVASITPVLGSAAAKQLSKVVDANLKVVAKEMLMGLNSLIPIREQGLPTWQM